LYIEGFWKDASIEFKKCLRMFPDDGPSLVLLNFMEKYDFNSDKA
jgi:hypothetical protein